jgi:phosphohistidine phosphatase
MADLRRPLADRGRRDAPEVGRWLRAHVDRVDLVVCSPAERTRQTWQLVAEQLLKPPKVHYDDRVYEASASRLSTVVSQLPEDARTVVLVGHNPGMSELVELLTGEPREFKTSSIAVLATNADWAEADPGWASIAEFATPRG